MINDKGQWRIEPIDLVVGDRTWNAYSYQDGDFRSPRGETRTERRFRRGNWSVRTTTRTVLSADPTHFHIHAELDAFEGDVRVFSRNWQKSIPRDFV